MIKLFFITFFSTAIFSQSNIDSILPDNYTEHEKYIFENNENLKLGDDYREKLFIRRIWVIPLKYNQTNNVYKSTYYVNGEEFNLVGREVESKEGKWCFGVIKQGDSIIYTIRWNLLFDLPKVEGSNHFEFTLYDKNNRTGIKKLTYYVSDSVCYSENDLRLHSMKEQKIHFKNQNYQYPFKISFNYFEGKSISIYWVAYDKEIQGEMIIDSVRYTLTGLSDDKYILLTAYDNNGITQGVVKIANTSSKQKSINFRNNCTDIIDETIQIQDSSKIKQKFGDVYLPQAGGFSEY